MKDILDNLKTVAIIGSSANKFRTSYHIANYLKENGIRILPINPNYEEVLGVKCRASLDEVPKDITIDVVDIFRNSDYTADMVRDIISWSEKTGQKPVIWTQLDVSTDEAKSLAEEAGFKYVENECLMVQHERLAG
ncbi:CoA-binding protein [Fodinibius sp. Rm-B-1B1-1]|uniref:CoA-binding protein n=1 Tax=Fodinibius alkaliphilus TaxID=3140241 RepID=UPI00315AE878